MFVGHPISWIFSVGCHQIYPLSCSVPWKNIPGNLALWLTGETVQESRGWRKGSRRPFFPSFLPALVSTSGSGCVPTWLGTGRLSCRLLLLLDLRDHFLPRPLGPGVGETGHYCSPLDTAPTRQPSLHYGPFPPALGVNSIPFWDPAVHPWRREDLTVLTCCTLG